VDSSTLFARGPIQSGPFGQANVGTQPANCLDGRPDGLRRKANTVIVIKNILVATDFSEPSRAALLYGRNFARQHGARLHVLHVVDDVASRVTPMTGVLPNIGALQLDLDRAAQAELDEALTSEDRRELGALGVLLTSSLPAQCITSYAKNAAIDLIIIGTHGRGGLAHFFLGSVAQQVVRTAPCPVLTVRHPERDFLRPDVPQTTAAVLH
jgi:nucleotide-binding universal stress UspA family protein